ncbi:long-chain fatty acid--CoA ligase [Gordonia sp. TBRC 11910]|uniref:Long-chain fatty acid--CoA ligase n=1 Tax=Gordonia asplenii TaxID=2725283 RepID=A0A848L533_9ACTN|nr:AMP-binding protein [Gordonia asplenii]NMO02728.1 long-chain fatty acid--CoA ligase [Gordonia asplenii]
MHFALLPDTRAAQAPTLPAIADDDRAYDNAAFADAVRRVAAGLADLGVGAGDVVAILLPNNADLIITLFAAWRLGAATTPINPALTDVEVQYQVSDAGSKVLVTEQDRPIVDVIATTAAALHDAAPHAAEPIAGDDDLALLIYTSGTTGRPKGVRLLHRNLTAQAIMLVDALELTDADHSLLILPLFHANGIMVGTLSPLLAGGQTTIAGRFRPETFFALLEKTRPTYFSAVPTIYTMLVDLPTDVEPDTSSIRFGICGAAPASVELLAKTQERFGFPLVEGYGLSECTCVATANPIHGPRKAGTVGVALPGVEIRIGDSVATGERGEVLIAGPNVMPGYLNRPEDTAKTLVDGWLRTGDIGFLDADGYLTLVDRAKDMIIRGGENIYPKEIESVVYRLPQVAEAAVIGRSDAKFGEVPVLYVSLNAGESLDTTTILAHLTESLTKYKLPVEITVLDTLPKNAVGKLDKPTLRRQLTPTGA